MTSETSKTSGAPPPPPPPFLTSKQIVLPLEMILYMAKFMKFEDYRSFIQSLWPNNDECDMVRRELWKLSTYQCETEFLNGNQLQVEYNFDPARRAEDRLLINVDYLLPAIGYSVPPDMDEFINLTNLIDFVRMQLPLNMCSNFQHASCPCHLGNFDEGRAADASFVKPALESCEYGHHHHYCQEHVVQWMIFSLGIVIVHQQVGDALDDEVIEGYLYFLNNGVCFQESKVHIWGSITIPEPQEPM